MVKAATATNLTITATATAQAVLKPYQQGTIPGFELAALTSFPSPVTNGTNQAAAQGDQHNHAILPITVSDSTETEPDSARPNRDPASTTRARTKAGPRAKRGSWSAGVPMADGYCVYTFYKHQPEKNVLREYRLEYAPSLWSAHVVARRWGRRGGKERLAQLEFTGQAEALDYLRRQVAKRVGRGYVLVR